MGITISGENNNDRILASDGVLDSISGINAVGVVTATSFTGDLIGDVTGNLTGNVTGNINNSTLLLQTGGTERVRINSGGEVLIGTTTGTGNNLTVQDAGTSTTAGGNIVARFQSNGSGRDASIQLSDNVAHSALISMVSSNFGINLSGTERFRITSSGNIITNTSGGGVGIRTDTPTTTLHVRGAGVFTSQIGSTITNGLFLDPGDTGPGNRPDIVLKGAGSAALNIKAMEVYYNNGSTKAFHMRYDGGTYHQGNIGIGTESPNAPLQINNASPKIILEDNDNAADISIHNVGGAAVYSSAGDTVFQTANTSEKLRITSTGQFHMGGGNSWTYASQKFVVVEPNNNLGMLLQGNNANEGVNLTLQNIVNANNAYSSLSFADDGGQIFGVVRGKVIDKNANTGELQFHTSSNERLRIESDGTLTLKNNSGMMIDLQSSAANGSVWMEFSDTDGTRKGYIGYGSGSNNTMYIVQQKANNMEFYSNNSTRFIIQSNGNKIVQNGRLNISSTFIDFSGSISTPQTAAAIYRPADNTLAFSTANNERLRITSGGNLIVGDTANRLVWGITPALQVNGTTWNDSSIAIHNFGNNTNRPTLLFTKGRSGTLGNYGTPVNAGEGLGIIGWSAHDSTDAEILACYIQGISESAPTTNNQYGAITFSTVNGGTSAYERMRVTKEGYVKTPYQPSFLATFGGNNNTSHNNGDYMKLNSMDHNTGNCYNTSNYRFTAPVAGNYLFYGRANMSGVGSGDYSRSYQVRLYKNGSSQQFHMTRTTLTGYSGSYPDTSTMVCSINLAANDYVQLKVNWETDGTLGTTENLHHHGSLFGGYLIG